MPYMRPSAPPHDFEHIFRLGRRQIAAGDLEQARKTNDILLEHHPERAFSWIQRSRIESMQDHYRRASDHASKAAYCEVRDKEEALALMSRLRTFGLDRALRDTITRLPTRLLDDPEVVLHVANMLQALNDTEAAHDYLQNANASSHGHAALQAAKAQSLIHLGRFDEARVLLEAHLERNIHDGFGWWLFSRLVRAVPDANHIDVISSVIARTDNSPYNRALLNYALHHQLDDLGRHAEATLALEAACKARRQSITYSADDDAALFARLLDMTLPPPVMQNSPFVPVFIVGMHRSGTTLLEQLLSGHEDFFAAGETYEFTSQLRYAADHHCPTELDAHIVAMAERLDYGRIGAGYLEAMQYRAKGTHRFMTDKLPSNFLNLGFIATALPQARILHMVRDPVEICLSNLREPFSDTTCRYSYDRDELARYYLQYTALMEHWQRMFPERILEVSYRRLAADPRQELEQVMKFLGAEYLPAMLNASDHRSSINTASAISARAIPHLPERAKWLPYADYLAPITTRLYPARSDTALPPEGACSS